MVPQLFLLVNDEHDVAQVYQGRRGDEDDLHHPETDVGDGEDVVVAHVLTTGLLRVADEARLLVPPHVLSPSTQDQDPEDEQNTHPYLSQDRGVGLHLVQEPGEK
uniref:Uncharacterized protein n=1 Tax=Scleropages formosus TaxID=113540 RepID=A0A8C9QRY4_SCLFO